MLNIIFPLMPPPITRQNGSTDLRNNTNITSRNNFNNFIRRFYLEFLMVIYQYI